MSSSQQPPRPLSHLSPVPITQNGLSAHYDNDNKLLLLTSRADAVHITTDIHFRQIQILGGLLFVVEGWVGPVTQGTEPYTVTDSFPIELPSRVFPSGYVVIKGAENAQFKVKIQPLLKDGAGNNAQTASTEKADFDVPNVKLIPPTEPIITKLGQNFTIRQSDQFNSQGGTVDVAFNQALLKLTNARIVDSKIEWVFSPLQTGNTQVSVFVASNNPPFAFRVLHNVEIKQAAATETLNPLALFSVASASKATNDNTEAEIAQSGGSKIVIPSWDSTVNAGLNLIKKQFPSAKLQSAEGRSPTGAGVKNPFELSKVSIIARLDGNKTATVRSQGFFDFGPVKVGPLLLGVAPFDWPVKVNSNDAFAIVRKAGYQQPVDSLSLSQPVVPTVDQPLYTLTLGDQTVQLGATDGKIIN
ncbi:hypothetical protein CORC01_06769 [Colletotrichum orchidophilum]|uniref:Uncharacterized protein n=1 Tax=Colletotrichum orchidophilum TaxID=1209926 RepID=A0A1G4B996_9PEZI|nr:uncharacterized protein CORC01_06769 [Colletotrichum orchidophilum]OHE97906.1 hypothetical protein CORC01_06769 [Colletotrichum orchidophilum]